MSERQPGDNRNWDLIKLKLNLLRLRARFATDEAARGVNLAVHDLMYRTATSSQERERGSLMAEVFTGEAMNFLNDNLTAKLSPLRPTREQVGVFQFLMESINNKSLLLKRTDGRIWSNNKPFVVKNYQAGERFNARGVLGSSQIELFSGKEVHLNTRWGVHEPFPHGFNVFGSIGISTPRGIDFMTLPKKAENPEETRILMGLQEREGSFTQHLEVYDKGERIIIYKEGVYEGKNISSTDQYFLVGAFDGEETQKTYWLYGSNYAKRDRVSISQKVGDTKTVTHLS